MRRVLHRPCVQDVLQSWLLLRSGMPPSSSPRLPLNLSLFILFLSPSLIPLTFISDPCFGIFCGSHSSRTPVCSLRTAHADSAARHPCAPPMAACHRQPWGTCVNGTCRAYTPPRVGMTPSPFIFSLSILSFLFVWFLCFYS